MGPWISEGRPSVRRRASQRPVRAAAARDRGSPPRGRPCGWAGGESNERALAVSSASPRNDAPRATSMADCSSCVGTRSFCTSAQARQLKFPRRDVACGAGRPVPAGGATARGGRIRQRPEDRRPAFHPARRQVPPRARIRGRRNASPRRPWRRPSAPHRCPNVAVAADSRRRRRAPPPASRGWRAAASTPADSRPRTA